MTKLHWRTVVFLLGWVGFLCAWSAPLTLATDVQRQAEVEARERAFAATMAKRDLRAFGEFIAEDAVFFAGDVPLRGKVQVIAAWTRHFDTSTAPFSWSPESTEVLATGVLAITSGPVSNPAGQTIARFLSIWRRDADATWRIVFDRGEEICQCSAH